MWVWLLNATHFSWYELIVAFSILWAADLCTVGPSEDGLLVHISRQLPADHYYQYGNGRIFIINYNHGSRVLYSTWLHTATYLMLGHQLKYATDPLHSHQTFLATVCTLQLIRPWLLAQFLLIVQVASRICGVVGAGIDLAFTWIKTYRHRKNAQELGMNTPLVAILVYDGRSPIFCTYFMI